MMLRILADDLTGALDTAAAFAAFAPVPVHLAVPTHDAAPRAALVTGTREVDAATLPERLAAPARWLAEADIAFKKVDSLLRGNTFAELAVLLRMPRFERMLFAPAFPAQGRITVDGRQWVRGADGLCAAVGAQPLAERLAANGIDVARVSVPGVRHDAELRALARGLSDADTRRQLWCGSAGLGMALADKLDESEGEGEAPPHEMPMPLLAVTASRHPVLRLQIARLQESGAATVCAMDDAGDAAALADMAAVLREGRPVLLDLSLHHAGDAVQAAAALAQRALRLCAALPRPPGLLVIGGDTLLALCGAAGVRTLLAHAAPRAGWGSATLQGGAWDGIDCLSRSGAFGAPDELAEALARAAHVGIP